MKNQGRAGPNDENNIMADDQKEEEEREKKRIGKRRHDARARKIKKAQNK